MNTKILLYLSLLIPLAACGDKDGDSGDDGTTADGADGADGTADGADGTADGADGTADGADGADGSDGSDGGGEDDLAIAGSWTDGFGGDHVITNETWSSYGGSSVFNISKYDNDTYLVLAQNDASNEYFPELWSRFDWTTDSMGQLWYCQTAYDAESEEAATNATPPDATDPATGGCSGFSWSSLTAAE